MSEPSFTLAPFFNREVEDEYGFKIGKIVFLSTRDSRSEEFVLEALNGDFVSCPSFLMKQDAEKFVLMSPLKHRAERLIETIPLAWRKNQVLHEISGSKGLPSELFVEMEKEFRDELERLKTEAQDTLKSIEMELDKHARTIKELNSISIRLQVEHGINRIDTRSFLEVKDSLERGQRRTESMKGDLEKVEKRLRNVVLGETPVAEGPLFSRQPVSAKQKDAELVVRIQEVSERGI